MAKWRNKRKSIVLFLLILAPVLIFPQSDFTLQYHHRIDSLQKLLPGAKAEKCVDILNELASCYAPTNFDSAILYSSRAARLAAIYKYSKGSGMAKFQAGTAYYYKMDFKNALINFLSSQPIFENEHYYNELGDLYLMLGHMNFFITRRDEAAYYYRKAIACFEKTGNAESLNNSYGLMAAAFFFLGGPPIDSALFYTQKTLDYAKKIRDRRREAHALLAIGMIYMLEDMSLSKKQKFLAYNDTALKMVTAFKDEDRMCIIHVNTGTYYDDGYPRTKDPELSKVHYLKGLELARKTDNKYMQSLCLNLLSNYDIQEGKYGQAESRLDSSEARLNEFFRLAAVNAPGYIFDPFNKIFTYYLAKREKTNLYQIRFDLARAKGDYRKAIEYQRLAFQLEQEFRAEQQGQQLDMLTAEDEANKQKEKIRALAKDNELARLNLSRTRLIFIGAGAGVVIISLFLLLWFQRKRWKAEQKSIILEQKLLRSQMNPHFIFNSLASIQNFVVNHKANEASIYLSRFSQLVRNILDNSTEEYVPLHKEIETIRHYLELQQVRYAGQFTWNLTVDEKIDGESMMIPPMLAQPFIENSIEHGIRYKETAGHIDIRFRLEDDQIWFEVEDDGVGREKSREIGLKQNRVHRSLSTSITHDRLIELNKKLKTKIHLDITDLKNDRGEACGTRVTFGIPLVEK